MDISALALKFELTGGLIKNAVQAALCKACARSTADEGITNDNSNQVVLTHSDLIDGAQLQLRSFLKLKGLETQMVPSVGLDDVILNEPLKEKLHQIVNHEKARAILYGQWGFGKKHGNARGLCAMFAGIPGSGNVRTRVSLCVCIPHSVKCLAFKNLSLSPSSLLLLPFLFFWENPQAKPSLLKRSLTSWVSP